MTIGSQRPRSQQPRPRATPHPIDDEFALDVEVEDGGGTLRMLATIFIIVGVIGVGATVLAFLAATRSVPNNLTLPGILLGSSLAVFAFAAILRALADVVLQLRIQSELLQEIVKRRNNRNQ